MTVGYLSRLLCIKSAIPRKFKRTTVVNEEKVAMTPVEKKKTTTGAKVNPFADPKIPKPVEPVEVTKKDVALPSKKIQVISYETIFINEWESNGERGIKNDILLPTQKAQAMKWSLPTNGKASPVKVNRDASAGSNNVIKEIASKLGESKKSSKVKALVNAFETMISASKLAEIRKGKVKALVDAFETVITLQDGKPSST